MIVSNKRANMLTENAVGLVIGILCVALIIGVGFWLFNVFADSTNKNIKSTLDSIEGKMNNLQVGQESILVLPGFKSADNLFMYGWDADDLNKPDACLYNACICVCVHDTTADCFGLKDYCAKGMCQKNGVCRSFDAKKMNVIYKYRDSVVSSTVQESPRIELQTYSMTVSLERNEEGYKFICTDPQVHPALPTEGTP